MEGFSAFVSGAVYGLTSIIVGHPLDTLKTKMQAQNQHLTSNSFQVLIRTIKADGLIGLYRGCIPPLLGASLLRSVQFGIFETSVDLLKRSKTLVDSQVLGIDSRIYLAGICSGIARAVIECPLEVAKIRRQVGESWRFRGLFKGFGANLTRNVPLLTLFFAFVDLSKRIDISAQWRPFITGSVCSTLAWTVVWPFDVIKSRIQAESGYKGSIYHVFLLQYRTFGIRGFFRGYLPGATRSLIANGLSMVMYVRTMEFLKA